MEHRAERLLAMTDAALFRAGGCHVFALTLREQTNLSLLWIHEYGGSFDHVVCQKGGLVVDYFGWFSQIEYVRAEMIEHRRPLFDPIEEEEVRSRFIFGDGPGYYAHRDFLAPATERARAWIRKHQEVFDGTRKIALPGLSRVQKASQEELDAIFGPNG